MTWFVAVLESALETFLVAAPWLLFGLFAAGWMHLLLPKRQIHRWLGDSSLGSVTRAAAFGVPMPICSCGVIPLSLTLREKGASKPSTLSFLITTPESGPDSIALTWGLMGPVMAIVRPIASILTAWIGGILYILIGEKPSPKNVNTDLADATCCNTASTLTTVEADSDEVSLSMFGRAMSGRSLPGEPNFFNLLKRALNFSFIKLLDDIAFWLVIGILATGFVSVLVPNDLAASGLGDGFLAMALILIASIPLYVCASASTPIAAALIAKGISPGTALVFLLAGPATNAASLIVLRKNFGKRFIYIYLSAIILGSLGCGLLFDQIIQWFNLSVAEQTVLGHQHGGSWVEWSTGIILLIALIWRFKNGAAKDGLETMWRSIRALFPGSPETSA